MIGGIVVPSPQQTNSSQSIVLGPSHYTIGYLKDQWLNNKHQIVRYLAANLNLPNMKMFDLSFVIIFTCWFAVSFPVSFSSSPNPLNGQHLRVIWVVKNTNDLRIKLILTIFKF